MVDCELPPSAVIPVSLQIDNSPARITLRPPTREDASDMWRLASQAVDTNSSYSFLMLVEYLADTCAVAVDDRGTTAGFVTGFRLPNDPETLFVWQVAVADTHRGIGLGTQLLRAVAERPAIPRLRFLEATVTPDNEASASLFRKFARDRDTECREEDLFETEDFPGEHDAEVRFRVGPF